MDEMALFWQAHERLPRQAPGSDATTRHLLRLAAPPAAADVLDVGCGPGRSSLVLARELPAAQVTAVDLHQPFLDELDAAAAAAGIAHRITTRCAPMEALPFDDASFDLIWSEGAIYHMGFAAGLAAWRRLLRPRGTIVVTEATWFTDARSAAARAFWTEGYPAMTDVATNERLAIDAGYDVVATFPLPPQDWWAEYYDPLAARLDAIAAPFRASDADLPAVTAAELAEIALYRDHGEEYGYTGFVLRRTA